jgi:SAM-dependent methyltransferase
VTFDSLAAAYDSSFGLSPTGRLFRFRVGERVMSEAPPPARVLDIGCGTGDDAIWLAGQGYLVHAVDESPQMIELARAKARQTGSLATFECRSLQGLAGDAARYDVVISNFGALNCVPLDTWAGIVPRLLTPSGHAFVVLIGRRPLPEGIRRGFGRADRGRVADVPVGGSSIRVHYESIAAVSRALSPTSAVDRVEALGCLVPGPGQVGFAKRRPVVVGLLAMAESLVRAKPFFKHRGDHTLFEFRPR